MSADVEIKPQVYKDPRPSEYFDRFHERARRRGPGPEVYEVLRLTVVAGARLLFRARGLERQNVPDGPVILSPNHASFLDHFFVGAFLRRRVQFMAKSQLFSGPLGRVISRGGAFPVRRGYQDEEAFRTAFAILGRGGAVVMYPEGGRSRTGSVGTRARPGVGRLALESGAPVVPVAIVGSHHVRNWKRLEFPRITVRFGEPLRFERVERSTREQQQRVADQILERIRELHGELERMGAPAPRETAKHAAGAQ